MILYMLDDLLTSIGQLNQHNHQSIQLSGVGIRFLFLSLAIQLRILFYTEAIRLTFSNTACSTCSSTMRIQFPTRDCAKRYLAVTRKTVAPTSTSKLSRLLWGLQTCHYDFLLDHTYLFCVDITIQSDRYLWPIPTLVESTSRPRKMSINFRNSTAYWV